MCVCVLAWWPHCLSPWKSQSYRKENQCELFIHGSNPQIYCHLICGYGTALMALMPSNRCPCSVTQVSLHLVTPLSPGTRWPTAHFILSSGGNRCMKTCIIFSWRIDKTIEPNVHERISVTSKSFIAVCEYEYYALIWMIVCIWVISDSQCCWTVLRLHR